MTNKTLPELKKRINEVDSEIEHLNSEFQKNQLNIKAFEKNIDELRALVDVIERKVKNAHKDEFLEDRQKLFDVYKKLHEFESILENYKYLITTEIPNQLAILYGDRSSIFETIKNHFMEQLALNVIFQAGQGLRDLISLVCIPNIAGDHTDGFTELGKLLCSALYGASVSGPMMPESAELRTKSYQIIANLIND